MLMAIIRFPLRVTRMVCALFAGASLWLWHAAQDVYGQVTYAYSSSIDRLTVSGDNNDNFISLAVDNDCVVLWTSFGSPTSQIVFDDSSNPVAPGQVKSISVSGGDGDDSIHLGGVSPGNDGWDLGLDRNVSIHGGDGNDTIIGSGFWNAIYGGTGADCLVGGTDVNDIYHNTDDDPCDPDDSEDTIVVRPQGGLDVVYRSRDDDGDIVDDGGDGFLWDAGCFEP